jgi:hypothetical protein
MGENCGAIFSPQGLFEAMIAQNQLIRIGPLFSLRTTGGNSGRGDGPETLKG